MDLLGGRRTTGERRERRGRADDDASQIDAPAVTPLPFPVRASGSALIEGLRKGHPGAACALYDRYCGAVAGVLTRIFGLDEDLGPWVRGTFVAALANIDRLSDSEGLWGWLLGEMVALVRPELRRRRRRRLLSSVLRWPRSLRQWRPLRGSRRAARGGAPARPFSVGVGVGVAGGGGRIAGGAAPLAACEIIGRFPVEEQLAFALRILEGLSFVETCAACRAPLRTVRRRLWRAGRRFTAAARRDPVLSAWLQSEHDEADASDGGLRAFGASVAVFQDGARRKRPAPRHERERERDAVVAALLAAPALLAASERERPRRPRWPHPDRVRRRWMGAGVLAGLAAAAVALAVALGGPATPGRTPPPGAAAGNDVGGGSGGGFTVQDGGGAHEGRPAEWLTAPASGETVVTFAEKSSLRLSSRARGRVLEAGPRQVVAVLESGGLHASAARTGRHWRFHAGPIEVDTSGAQIDLLWDPERERATVSVLEGRAVVSGSCLDLPRMLGGQGAEDRIDLLCRSRRRR